MTTKRPSLLLACALALQAVLLAPTPSEAIRSRIAHIATIPRAGEDFTSQSFAASAVTDTGRFVSFYSAGVLTDDDTHTCTDVIETPQGGQMDTARAATCTDAFVRDLLQGLTVKVSVSTSGVPGSFDTGSIALRNCGDAADLVRCDPPALSPDGRYVAFESMAPELATGTKSGDQNRCHIPSWPAGPKWPCADVFVRDRDTRLSAQPASEPAFDEPGFVSTTRISVAADGGDPNGASGAPAMSDWRSPTPDGPRGVHVAFESDASNLVPGDVNATTDIFVRDVANGRTVWISRPMASGAPGDSRRPSISADGRFVAFESTASNLAPGDGNNVCLSPENPPSTQNCPDIFLHDRDTDEDGVYDQPGGTSTTLVSRNVFGVQGNEASTSAVLSADGKVLTFASRASNLTADDLNETVQDIVYLQVETGLVSLASISADGLPADDDSFFPALSFDGRFISFQTEGELEVEDDNDQSDIYMRDTLTGRTVRITWDGECEAWAFPCHSFRASVSPNGRFVAFDSELNLDPADGEPYFDVYVVDRATCFPSATSEDGVVSGRLHEVVEPQHPTAGGPVHVASCAMTSAGPL